MFEKGEHVSFANCGLPYHIGGQIPDRGKLLLATPKFLKQVFNIEAHTGCEVTAHRPGGQAGRGGRSCHAASDWKESVRQADSCSRGVSRSCRRGTAWTGRTCSRSATSRTRIASRPSSTAGQAKRAVVIGAGYIGLEMVEALSSAGPGGHAHRAATAGAAADGCGDGSRGGGGPAIARRGGDAGRRRGGSGGRRATESRAFGLRGGREVPADLVLDLHRRAAEHATGRGGRAGHWAERGHRRQRTDADERSGYLRRRRRGRGSVRGDRSADEDSAGRPGQSQWAKCRRPCVRPGRAFAATPVAGTVIVGAFGVSGRDDRPERQGGPEVWDSRGGGRTPCEAHHAATIPAPSR